MVSFLSLLLLLCTSLFVGVSGQITVSPTCNKVDPCYGLRDVLVLVDTSTSMSQTRIDNVIKPYLKSLFPFFLGTPGARMGVAVFSRANIKYVISIQEFFDQAEWDSAIDAQYAKGSFLAGSSTPFYEALAMSLAIFQDAGDVGNAKQLLILSDGLPEPFANIGFNAASQAPIRAADFGLPFYGSVFDGGFGTGRRCFNLTTNSVLSNCEAPGNVEDYFYGRVPDAAKALTAAGVEINMVLMGAVVGRGLQAVDGKYWLGQTNIAVGSSLYAACITNSNLESVEGIGALNYCIAMGESYSQPNVNTTSPESPSLRLFDTKACACGKATQTVDHLVNLGTTPVTPDLLFCATSQIQTDCSPPPTISPTPAIVTKQPTTSSPTTAEPTTSSPTTAEPTTKTPTTAQPTYPSCGVCSDETAWALQLPKPVGTSSSLPWYDFTTGWGSYVKITEGQTITGTIYAGRSKVAGTFTFKWENGKIGVTWNLCGDWALTSTWHFYYGVSVPGSAPGSYPYQNTVDNAQSQPWMWFNEPVGCGTTLYLALHLEVDCEYVTPNPTTTKPTTGKPTTVAPTGKPTTAAPTRKPTTAAPTTGEPTTSEPTAAVITKNPTTDAPTSNCGVCSDETAWALQLPKPVGTSSSRPWYDFTTGWGSYVKITKGQTITGTIYAGRSNIAGTYSFKWVNGKIGVTWSLCEDWALTNTWHFYYGVSVPGSAPGSYPYQITDGGLKSQPWIWFNEPAGCGSYLYLALHVEVDCDLLTDAPTTSTPTAAVVTNKPTTSSSSCVEVWMDFIQNSGPLSNYPNGEQVWDSSPSSVTLTGKLRAPGGLSPLAPNEPFGTSTVTIQSDRSKATFYFDVGVGRRIKTAKVYFGLYSLSSNSWVGKVWTPKSQTVTIPSGCTKFFKGCDVKRFAAAVLCVENVSS